jgi:hypothetical protein
LQANRKGLAAVIDKIMIGICLILGSVVCYIAVVAAVVLTWKAME